jgi:hypothetical protein
VKWEKVGRVEVGRSSGLGKWVNEVGNGGEGMTEDSRG